MKSFTQWAAQEKLELPAMIEDASRGGIAHWAYPQAYKAGQYTPGYFMAHTSDALLKLGKGNPRSGPSYEMPPA